MKQYLTGLIVVLALCATPLWAQESGSIRGTVKDVEEKPVPNAVVEIVNRSNGRKYDLKTNKNGEFFSIGIQPGVYDATVTKDGKPFDTAKGIQVPVQEEKDVEFNLKKEQAQAAAASGISAEELKKRQEANEKAMKENAVIKQLNDKLAAAKQASDTGDYDSAIAQVTQATQMDPNRDLLWAKLGEYTLASAGKQTDAAEKSKRYSDAAEDYQKAVDLKQKSLEGTAQKPADANKILAQYYNNLGQAYGKAGKSDDAVKAYTQAAQLDPAGSAQYYYNLGAVLTNTGKVDDAIAAFDKAIAADPNKAEAYYWKGVNMLGKATLKGDKMVAPEGTAEAFNKYLELQPNGQFAQPAKDMLASIGASVETQYGKQKKPTKK